MISRNELIAKGFSGDEADAYLADKALESEMEKPEFDSASNCLTEMGSDGYSCNYCGRPIKAHEKCYVCPDCGVIICEKCEMIDKSFTYHECEDDEYDDE